MRDLDWKILYELYRTTNITKVADKLYMSQPTLTKRLQAIEEEFDVRVVNRNSKGISFTPEGKYLAQQAESYLQFRSGIDHRMEAFREDGIATVRIASAVSFARRYLPALIREFRKEHLKISFDVQNARSAHLVEYLKDGTVDVAFVRGTYDNDLIKHRLLTENAYVISREPLDLSRLPDYPAVGCIYSEYTQNLLNDWWNASYTASQERAVTVEFVWIAIEMAMQGVGYAIVFEEEEMLKESKLWYHPISAPDGSPIERDTWMLYSRDKDKTPAAEEFILFAEQNF